MKFPNIVLLFSSMLCILVVTNIAQARVSSISPKSQVDIDGKSFTSITVECGTKSDRPQLLKEVGERQWCDSTIKSACYSDKIRAAKYVCSSRYSRAVKALDDPQSYETSIVKKSSESTEQLLVEQNAIEHELLDIRSKRLELRRQELRLKKELNNVDLQAG